MLIPLDKTPTEWLGVTGALITPMQQPAGGRKKTMRQERRWYQPLECRLFSLVHASLPVQEKVKSLKWYLNTKTEKKIVVSWPSMAEEWVNADVRYARTECIPPNRDAPRVL
jgi:hypothetical protein